MTDMHLYADDLLTYITIYMFNKTKAQAMITLKWVPVSKCVMLFTNTLLTLFISMNYANVSV